jgi:hypothetical protein
MQSESAHNSDTTVDPPLTDETAKLRELQANVRNQDELERELGRQVWISFNDLVNWISYF